MFVVWLLLICALAHFAVVPALADGCFVFKWNKKTDINEPTQKAIIVHNAGREDMLLQVKYEGPLNEFGWLIPVPSLPTVQKGTMEAFYELSQLTQRRFGVQAGTRGDLAAPSAAGPAEPVKVIAIKTVGAYEVVILSAKDSGSLARWLESNGYSLPDGKSGIVDDYIHNGWYFVAAKIQLNKPVAVSMVAGSSPKASKLSRQEQKAVRKKLASGELHPLLISFDTPKCVFPLKISALSGHASEVSLYVLSAQPLLNQFIFDEACTKLEQRRAEWDKDRMQREQQRRQCKANLEVLNLAYMLRPDVLSDRGHARNPFLKDFNAMAMEVISPMQENSLEDEFFVPAEEFFQCVEVGSEEIPKTATSLARLQGKHWFLTKIVRTFAPSEMRDLEFAPAIPAMMKVLSRPIGSAPGAALPSLGSNGVSVLLAACKSRSSVERMNAAYGFQRVRDRRAVEPLLSLLRDAMPEVRLCAIRAAANNWDQRFRNPLIGLFDDANHEIRSEAVGCLMEHEDKSRSSTYLALLKDSDPNVQLCATYVLQQINPDAIPTEPFVQMLKCSNPEVQCAALQIIYRMHRDVIPRELLARLLSSPQRDTVVLAVKLIEGTGQIRPELPGPGASAPEQELENRKLSSAEAAPLMTNQLGVARLMGLKIMERNADTRAIELTIPLLRDKYAVIQNRALAVLKSVTGKSISQTDPAAWERWWAANRSTFKTVKHH